ncbi:MAG: hypothetical protein ACRD9Q_04460 [Nitrososphaeraceae archaeon]
MNRLITIAIIFLSSGLFINAIAEQSNIPSWIKNTAKWWADGQIEEYDFVQSMQYLVNSGILKIPLSGLSSPTEDQNTYALPKYGETSQVKISGAVTNFKSGTMVQITVIKPDGNTIKQSFPVSNISGDAATTEGQYSGIMLITYDFPIGTYQVIGKYNGKEIQPSYFYVVQHTSTEIPAWIKNNAGWWADGKISDGDFIAGIQFLIQNKMIKFDPQMHTKWKPPENLPDLSKKTSIKSFLPTKDGTDWKTWKISERPESEEYFARINLVSQKDVNSIVTTIQILFKSAGNEFDDEYTSTLQSLEPDFSAQTIGDCYESLSPDDNEFILFCVYKNYHIHITSKNAKPDELIKNSEALMDGILEKINKSLNIEYNVKISDIRKSTISEKPKQPTTITSPGFSNTVCKQDEYGYVVMTGKFTNGPTAYSSIYFKLGVIARNGDVVATGIGVISNVAPYQTKLFDAQASYDGDFASCEIEVSDAFP